MNITLYQIRNDKTGRILKPGTSNSGYLSISIIHNKIPKTHPIHRLVAKVFVPNPDAKRRVDHIDNHKTNNWATNLRWATDIEDLRNRRIFKNNKSGSKGVHWSKASQKWTAVITVNSKKINLGFFHNKEDAILIRKQRANVEFGEYINKCEIINV